MMAEGGYLEGILEFNDVTKEVDHQENYQEASVSDSVKEKKDSMVNSLNKDLKAFASEPIADVENGKNVDCEAFSQIYDLESASSELKAVEEAHEKLVVEKDELILILQSKSSMAKDVIAETKSLENTRIELQKQVDQTYAKIKAENDVLEEMKQSEKKSLAENEILKEHARVLKLELARYEELKRKRDDMMKEVMDPELNSVKEIEVLSSQTNHNELLSNDTIIDEVKKEADNFCEIQGEIQNEAITMKKDIEDNLKATRNAVMEMEMINSKISESVLTKAKEIQDMKSRLQKVKDAKMKRTRQLEEILNPCDKLADGHETGSSNVDGTVDLNNFRDNEDEFNVSHEEALSKIRQHQEDVLSDFERQLQAVKEKKHRPEKKKANKNKK